MGTQKNRLIEHPKHVQKIMGKKIVIIQNKKGKFSSSCFPFQLQLIVLMEEAFTLMVGVTSYPQSLRTGKQLKQTVSTAIMVTWPA